MNDAPVSVTAVFDVGKTNKKFFLFDENYEIVLQNQISLEQIEDEDQDPAEDLDALVDWIRSELTSVLENPRYQITDLNFSTYGASLVHLDEQDEPVTPVYDYLKPYPDDIKKALYSAHGGEEQFALETASPPMGMLNSGLQLYWLKNQKKDLFKKIRNTLHFPQYLSFLFTRNIAAELTSVGCHTAMWDFCEMDYHNWLEEEGLRDLLPTIEPVTGKQSVTYNDQTFNVGMGIHDSSAALAPYLNAMDSPFLLLSTGTWSITFNPFSKGQLTFEELQRDCLCYLNIYGEQVKAARVYLGNEYRHQKEKLMTYFNIEEGQDEIDVDSELLKKLVTENSDSKKLKLETAHSSGPFQSEESGIWNISQFSSYREAYHQLLTDLVTIQHECIQLTEGTQNVENVIVTGGFGNNDFFLKLLATRLPGKKVYSASMPHATAIGAAMVMHDGNTEAESLKKLLSLNLHTGLDNTGLENYSRSR
ncbi:FGGY-family carbohydrate kinase [soil metagenome]